MRAPIDTTMTARPSWVVRVSLLGVRSREVLLACLWAMLGLAVVFAGVAFVASGQFPPPLRVLLGFGGLLLCVWCALAALAYWMALRWADRTGWWARMR